MPLTTNMRSRSFGASTSRPVDQEQAPVSIDEYVPGVEISVAEDEGQRGCLEPRSELSAFRATRWMRSWGARHATARLARRDRSLLTVR